MVYTSAQHLEEGIRLIVREETADMRSDIAEMQVDIADLRTETDRHGVLLEDVLGKLDTVLETLSDTLGVKIRVGAHEGRLDNLEATQSLLTATVKDHSRRLKAA